MGTEAYAPGILVLALSLGCAAGGTAGENAPVPPRPAPSLLAGGAGSSTGADPEPGVLGRIAGAPLLASELLLEWNRQAPRQVWLVLDKLVAARIARVEAARLGLALDGGRITEALARERRRQDAELARAAGGRPIDAFLRDELGQDPARYYDALRVGTLERLMVERVVRAWTLARENRAVRLLALPEGADMEPVEARLEAGEDFGSLARELSVDDTAAAGGYVPFLVEDARVSLSRLAFLTPPGEVGGPVRAGEQSVLVRVEEVRPARTGSWEEVGELVERSLVEHPLSDGEYVAWKVAMSRQHSVDLGPLEELLGVP